MNNLPKILRHNTILTNWTGYPKGSLERAKALGIEVFSRSNSLEATIELWNTECELVDKEQPWRPLGLKNRDEYILAVTGKKESQINAKICKTQAIIQRRDKYPDETLQETANEIGVSRQFVHRVLSTKRFVSNLLVDTPDWIKGKADKTSFRKLSKEDQEKVRKAGKGSLRGIAIAAGVVKVPTIIEQLHRLWAKATPQERKTFLKEITCP